MKTIIRAVAYPRYSSDNQREESITAQMNAIEEYCKRKGYTLVGTYPDEARSATTDQRPNFQRMISDSEKGLFDVVVVHKLDRFARDRYDSAYYKRVLKQHGVRLESVLEQFDNSPESIILESVLEGMAEYYSKNLAREARKGMLENAKKGIHTGGRPPYGYKVNPDTRLLEIDPHTSKAVKLYFNGIKDGLSLQDIADRLNDLGYKTHEGRSFTKSSFATWASNRKYKGDYTWDVSISNSAGGKRSNRSRPLEEQIIIEGAVPAIIDKQLWEDVNKLMADRRKRSGSHKAKITYLLSGKLQCGKCGGVYVGNSYRNPKSADNTLLTYYKCNTKSCKNASIRKNELEEKVLREISNECFNESEMILLAERTIQLFNEQKSQVNDDIRPIKLELQKLETKINNWVESLGHGVISVIEKIKEAEQRKAALEQELLRIQAINHANVLTKEVVMEDLKRKKHLLSSTNEAVRKQVFHDFVEQIVIQPSNQLNDFRAEVTCRVFKYGGEGSRTPVRK